METSFYFGGWEMKTFYEESSAEMSDKSLLNLCRKFLSSANIHAVNFEHRSFKQRYCVLFSYMIVSFINFIIYLHRIN